MPRENPTTLLDELNALKTQFTPAAARRLSQLLEQLSSKTFYDSDSLFRYHELLLFVRAYPPNAAIVRAAEKELRAFARRVQALEEHEVDPAELQHPEVSGIAGSSVTDAFSFYIVRWLVQRYPAEVEIYWDWFEDENNLAETWPRLMPLLEEDAFVEANVPYREWLNAARHNRAELPWLIERVQATGKTDEERAQLYNSQHLYVHWTPGFAATRTGMRVATKKFFYHRDQLIQRRDVNLKEQLAQPSPDLRKLSSREGERAIEMAREASTIRYRELYGFTHGDPEHVYHAELGRGVELFLMGLPAEKRLPLRAYHSVMIYKNGVPIGYFEGLSLFERMETGLNLYYTFRDGETAWMYACLLNVMHHFAGVTAFSLDPYQIGYKNDEGIESGAFWFYRKLGFRPMRDDTMQLALKEEAKISKRKGYRTSGATLRKLAQSSMIFELDQPGDWDRFQIRKIGFKAQPAGKVESDLELVFSMIPDLDRWTREEKEQLKRIVKAKTSGEELGYLRLLQQHEKLREAIIKLGSGNTDYTDPQLHG